MTDADGKYYWPFAYDSVYLCNDDSMCAQRLPDDAPVIKCGNVHTEYGLDPRIIDKTDEIEEIFFDIVNFNHIGNAAVLIF